jgi:hypothetical protein
MEIDANMKSGAVNGLPAAKRSAGGTPPTGTETGSFASSSALEGALNSTPDVRADAVARGRALVSKDGYPPEETIKKMSDFLASRLQDGPE